VKSFSPAGMTQKGYFGRGARTFGNPGGATSGDGSFNGGGGTPTGLNWTFRGNVFAPTQIQNGLGTAHGTTILLDDAGNVFRSTDGGHTWNAITTLANFDGFAADVAFGSGKWIACSGTAIGDPAIWVSIDDGLTWGPRITTPPLPLLSGLNAIASDGAGHWVALGPITYMVSGDNGVTWTAPATFSPANWGAPGSLVFVNGLFTAPATQSGTGFSELVTSVTGAGAWTEHVIAPTTESFFANAVQSFGARFAIGMSTGDSRIAATPVALTAAATNPVTGGGGLDLAAGVNLFSVGGGGGSGSSNSTDGVNWIGGGALGMSSVALVVYDATHGSAIAAGNFGVSTFP
jgi:hypothetical protein